MRYRMGLKESTQGPVKETVLSSLRLASSGQAAYSITLNDWAFPFTEGLPLMWRTAF